MSVVLDISSDEEPCLEKGPESSDFDWTEEFLSMSDEESEDSDDVVVIRDVQPERKSKFLAPAVKDDDDDDCLILDVDPGKRVAFVDETGIGSDEVLIVGEKGQIACKDYPHPRHLCAKFPFSSTPHERHCDQCHCYVCDSLAPCLMWGTGILSTDHCHANDKTGMWKIQRNNFKLGKNAPLPASTNYGTSLYVEHPQRNEILPLDITQLSPNSMNQASGSTACRDYSHPRHLCAKFPFSSTPHERHCDQCHCYVCDSVAPCLMWGTGILSADHCHANDKTELWKIRKKNFKLGQSAPLPASTYNNVTLLCMECSQPNEILPLDITQLSPSSMHQASRSTATCACSSLNPIPQNQASQQIIVRPCSQSLSSSVQNQLSNQDTIPVCSTFTNFTIPDGANDGRYQESGTTLVRNRYRPHSVPRQLLGIHNHTIQRERGSGARSLGPQLLRSRMMSRGVGSGGGTLSTNPSTHGSK